MPFVRNGFQVKSAQYSAPLANARLTKIAQLSALAILLVALAGCDPSNPGGQSLAVSLGPRRQVRIDVRLCPGEAIRRVEVVQDKGSGGVGEESDPRLWAVISPGGSQQEEYTVGEVPVDFRAAIRAFATLPSTESLAAIVTTSETSFHTTFQLEDLRNGSLWSNGRLWSRDEFEERALKRCG